MSERFHIIVTGENGRSTYFAFSRSKFFSITSLLAACIIAAALIFITSGDSLFIGKKVHELEAELARTSQVTQIYLNEIEQLRKSQDERIEAIKQDYEFKLTNQQTQYDLENYSLKLESVEMMNSAIGDLNSRSELIESVMEQIGIKIVKPVPEKTGHRGGPFIPVEEQPHVALVKKVDEYLRTIKYLPLGRPVKGTVSSKFGNRTDPLNDRKGFHEGVDILANYGDKIKATAAGVVVCAYQNGGYGNYVEIDHGNGYRTIFGHLKSFSVKKGDSVKRGQIIGLVGNTGRSTGPHLHYEIRLNKKPINPQKFMKVADLTPALADMAQ